MLKFLRESIKEFDHVVWPTRAETKKYLSIVLSIIVALTVILFVLGSVFTTSLFALRDAIVPPQAASTSTTNKTPIDLSKLLSTGATASGSVVTASGAVKTASGTVKTASGKTK